MVETTPAPGSEKPQKKLYRKAVGSRLKKLLYVVFGLFALLGVNSVYLAAITFAEWVKGETFQNYFYQWMILGHLTLGLLITLPVPSVAGIQLEQLSIGADSGYVMMSGQIH